MTHKQYTIVVERAEGNYSAYAPDLPGVVAAGDTVEETECLMREAIVLYLQDRKSTRLNSSHSDRSRMPSSA